jgi:threonine/homoserine/homoserine lactone efflux protein
LIEAVGLSLPFAVGAAISPIPIVASVLLVSDPSAASKVPAFLAGWLAGLAVVGAAVVLLAGGPDSTRQEPGELLGLLMLAGGAGLLWLAVRTWGKRPGRGEEPSLPSWMSKVEEFGPRQSAGLGVAAAANPKNLLLTVGGALEIASAGASAASELAGLAVFVFVSSIGVLVPVALGLAGGDSSQEKLGRMRDWLARHNALIMSAVLLLLGASLVGDGIAALGA